MKTLKQILYIEDDPDIQMMTRMTLVRRGGFEVRTCGSGQDALKELRLYTPQLILLDVMMPDQDGISTLRALRQIPSAALIPVVFLTARVQKQEIEEYYALGAIGVITKPFDAATLCDTVQRLWLQATQAA